MLKNGGVLRWMAIDEHCIEFQGDRGVRLFIVPAECSLTVPERVCPCVPRGPRLSSYGRHLHFTFFHRVGDRAGVHDAGGETREEKTVLLVAGQKMLTLRLSS